MESMYQEYKDMAAFYLVYIREAHAEDSRRPVPYAQEKGIRNHTNYGERCQVATRLVDEKELTIPCLIDGMDNAAGLAYSAHPDRIFVVRTDGRLAITGKRGPFGFGPALEETEQWLAEFRKTGAEPGLDDSVASTDDSPVGSEG